MTRLPASEPSRGESLPTVAETATSTQPSNEEPTMNSILLAIALTAAAGFASKPDTSLVLKPSAAQIKSAKALDNPECPVSGEPNGSMGPGRTVIYRGKAVKLCCGSCVKKFAKDPAKFTAAAETPTKAGTAPAHDHHDHEGHHHH
jgi:hypothetical protein